MKTKANNPSGIKLSDGRIKIELTGGPNDGQEVIIDLVVIRLAFEAIEHKHKVREREGFATTPEFLADLAEAAERAGVTGCTLTQAFQLWYYVNTAWGALKKNTL